MDDREREIRQRLKDDFPHYAERCLKIRTKSGAIEPLMINRAQRYVHERLEEQKRRTGRVRAIILKARQQGFSTYIGARFYHQVTHRQGAQCFILTHEQSATDNLFGMVDRYHKHNHPLVKPSTGASNAKELYFDRLDSGYSVGTAGAKAVGRSKTVQLFHGSEAAFWPNAADHFAGVVQAVPDLPGTEIILESTANGIGGEFHSRWQQAEEGVGDYQAIFIPWFLTDEYRRPVTPEFELDDEEAVYAELYDLDIEQMAWRRAKIAELKDPQLFKQEYPATAAEAFQATGHDSYIPTDLVMRARKTTAEPIGALVCGADPARFGDDGFAVAWRRGRKVLKVERRHNLDTVQGAYWIKQIIDEDMPERFFVDVGGQGAGVVDILHSFGEPYSEIVEGVNFGSAPTEPPRVGSNGEMIPGPKNRRAEMWKFTLEWLQYEGGVDIPDDDSLHADAIAPGYRYDLRQYLLLESKEDIRKRNLRSPDGWDAVALTFAAPVADPAARRERQRYSRSAGRRRSAWAA